MRYLQISIPWMSSPQECKELQIACELVRSSRKTMAIQVKAEGKVIFRVPYRVPEAEVLRFAAQHRDWIGRQYRKAMEQTAALESDVREGMISEYLDKLLPEDWEKMDLAERRGFLRGDQFTGGNREGTVQRSTVCAVEIWTECFGKDPSTIKRSDTYDIFGMLMKIGGWEKYTGNKTGVLRRGIYGPQRCFVRKE